jgi:hypothetical protein
MDQQKTALKTDASRASGCYLPQLFPVEVDEKNTGDWHGAIRTCQRYMTQHGIDPGLSAVISSISTNEGGYTPRVAGSYLPYLCSIGNGLGA